MTAIPTKLPPPDRPGYSSQIAKMKKGDALMFPGASPGSIKTICSRLGVQLGRTYLTKRESNSVIVWLTETKRKRRNGKART